MVVMVVILLSCWHIGFVYDRVLHELILLFLLNILTHIFRIVGGRPVDTDFPTWQILVLAVRWDEGSTVDVQGGLMLRWAGSAPMMGWRSISGLYPQNAGNSPFPLGTTKTVSRHCWMPLWWGTEVTENHDDRYIFLPSQRESNIQESEEYFLDAKDTWIS